MSNLLVGVGPFLVALRDLVLCAVSVGSGYVCTAMIFAVRSVLAATGEIDPFGGSVVLSWTAVSAVALSCCG